MILVGAGLKAQALVQDLAQGQIYGFRVRAKNFQTIYGELSEEVTATPSPNGNQLYMLDNPELFTIL